MKVKVRRQWKIKPLTKIKESKKNYNRKKEKTSLRKEIQENF